MLHIWNAIHWQWHKKKTMENRLLIQTLGKFSSQQTINLLRSKYTWETWSDLITGNSRIDSLHLRLFQIYLALLCKFTRWGINTKQQLRSVIYWKIVSLVILRIKQNPWSTRSLPPLNTTGSLKTWHYAFH